MNIKIVKDKHTWDNIVLKSPNHTFLQSWAWGEFEKSMGHTPLRILLHKKQTPIAAAQLIIRQEKISYKLPLKNHYIYIPYGPLFVTPSLTSDTITETLEIITNLLTKLSTKYTTSYSLIEHNYPIFPQNSTQTAMAQAFKQLGYTSFHKSIQARHKWLLDLTQSESELMKSMRKVTRYNIRLAAKAGVKIRKSTAPDSINIAYRILKDTSKTKHFVIHNFQYYKNQFEILTKHNIATLYWAEHENTPIAFAIIFRFGQHAGYSWGGTLSSYRKKIPGAYPVLWEAIKDQKRKGVKIFDFWGIAPPRDKTNPTKTLPRQHRWYGLSFFKTGFGGYYEELPLPYVKIHNWLNYSLLVTIDKLRDLYWKLRRKI